MKDEQRINLAPMLCVGALLVTTQSIVTRKNIKYPLKACLTTDREADRLRNRINENQ